MKYLIEMRIGCEVKDTYEEAEIFCYEHGIHPEEIVEITNEEAEEILGSFKKTLDKISYLCYNKEKRKR